MNILYYEMWEPKLGAAHHTRKALRSILYSDLLTLVMPRTVYQGKSCFRGSMVRKYEYELDEKHFNVK